MGLRVLELLKGVARQRPWVPDHGELLWRQNFDRNRNARGGYSDHDHLRAAARWLAVAQDSQSDGGISGRYRLDRGWTSSYPETTGYLVPTLLALDKLMPGSGFASRAARAVDFLLRVQLKSGGFPGMEIADNSTEPSPFNTAQILNGLTAWHQATGDERAHGAAERAAGWLKSVQDDDGAFRKHTYLGLETTYTAHLSCWLAEWGAHARDEESLAAAERHLDWVLRHVKPNGWIEHMGFGKEQHAADEAFTHTIAYTLAGVLTTSLLLERADGIAVVQRAAEALLELTERERRLPGVISNFEARSTSTCLTGNAQMALVWFRLHRKAPNLRFVNVALKAIDHIKSVQPMAGRNSGIAGGIAGSDPVGGAYITNAFPNWAAKFFIDALMEKQAVLHELARTAPQQAQELPSLAVTAETAREGVRLSTVILTRPGSQQATALLKAIAELTPLTVVAVRESRTTGLARIEERLRSDGLTWLASRFAPNGHAHEPELAAFCREHGITFVETGPLDRPETLEMLRRLTPDLGIAVGLAEVSKDALASFRFGVVRASEEIPPLYRGASTAEWAALERGFAGCCVLSVADGSVLARRTLDIFDCRSVGVLRTMVEAARGALLREVLRAVLASGARPKAQAPSEPEGPRYYPMHRELVGVLGRKLEAQVWN